jgi:hypothetical protein
VAEVPEQREAQERLWKALTTLEYLEREPTVDRADAELELFAAWTDYEQARGD